MANRVILNTDNGEQIVLQANEPARIRLQGTSVLPNEYTAGEGLILTGKEFSIDTDIVAEKSDIGEGVLSIQKNGVNVATFNANSEENVTANITVPTDNSQLTNGMGYQKADDVQAAIIGKANVDLDNLSATGNAKFTGLMKTDASNASPRLATYAELLEVKSMMLGSIDWSNVVKNISLSVTNGTKTHTITGNGYIAFSQFNNFTNGSFTINDIEFTKPTSILSNADSLPTMLELIPVNEGDVLVATSNSSISSVSIEFNFYPQKSN